MRIFVTNTHKKDKGEIPRIQNFHCKILSMLTVKQREGEREREKLMETEK